VTDPPVTLFPSDKRSRPHWPCIPLYIEEGTTPEIGRFAMARNPPERLNR